MGYTLNREPVRVKDSDFARVDVKISRSIIAQGRQTRQTGQKKEVAVSLFLHRFFAHLFAYHLKVSPFSSARAANNLLAVASESCSTC